MYSCPLDVSATWYPVSPRSACAPSANAEVTIENQAVGQVQPGGLDTLASAKHGQHAPSPGSSSCRNPSSGGTKALGFDFDPLQNCCQFPGWRPWHN